MTRNSPVPDVRMAILEAASDLLCSHGYRQMTMDDIAREARIGKATIYSYFTGKEEVTLAVLDHHTSALWQAMSQIADGPGTPDERLRGMLLESATFTYNRARRHRMSIDDTLATVRPMVLARREHYRNEEARLLAAVIEEGQAQHLFANEGLFQEPLNAASTLITAAGGLMPYSLSPRELDNPEEFHDKAVKVVDLILRGVLKR